MSACPPPRSVACLASCRALAWSVSVAAAKSARPPWAWMAASTWLPRVVSRPERTTRAPRPASAIAAARPMPLLPPVTRAVDPVRLFVMSVIPLIGIDVRLSVVAENHLLANAHVAPLPASPPGWLPLAVDAGLGCHGRAASHGQSGHGVWLGRFPVAVVRGPAAPADGRGDRLSMWGWVPSGAVASADRGARITMSEIRKSASAIAAVTSNAVV